MSDDAGTADVLALTAQIVSAHVSKNNVAPDALPALIQDVYRTLSTVGREPAQADKPTPAVPVPKSPSIARSISPTTTRWPTSPPTSTPVIGRWTSS
jgi:predicted transcriptional regulator